MLERDEFTMSGKTIDLLKIEIRKILNHYGFVVTYEFDYNS